MAARLAPSHPYRILSIVGTRPEAIKMRPVLRALAGVPVLDQQVLLTGQHEGLGASFERYSRIELRLDLSEQSAGELRETIQDAIGDHLRRDLPDLVLVQGDTTSALAGALAAQDCRVPVAHVEAGLRSHKREPWPEEDNRVAIDAIADLLFAPTEAAAANLALEKAVRGDIHITGNSGIDALLHSMGSPAPSAKADRRRILVTSHRRENKGQQLEAICAALKRLVRELPVEVLFLLHSNPQRRAAIEAKLAGVEHIQLSGPVDHTEMIDLMLGSWLLLTDSGGLQEDGPALGIPVLVMRDVTERVEAPGNIELVGTDPDAIFGTVNRLLLSDTCYARMAQPAMPFGDGLAAPRIAAILVDWLERRKRAA
ncbi:MAG TPA: UDP-N-acetylglucosamine 2-epimerase (non-hydrolyzing) [Allosphingosinicella sp.]|uniref:non-hydrolyzing UDP-N-acetylglucosamine 2-epimerase n=1 Tax=Allosphingosinicella sp. TaxID=2823234 RepID=UPI002ED7C993